MAGHGLVSRETISRKICSTGNPVESWPSSAASQEREHTLLWLKRELPYIDQLVESQPEETNAKSEPTGTRLSPSVEDLDLSFDPD